MNGVLSLFLAGVLIPVAVAFAADEKQSELTLKDVQTRLKQNESFLKKAQERGRAGDAAGTRVAMENYQRGMEGINRALERGEFRGTEREHARAIDAIHNATSKNVGVLTDLLERVPEAARPGIERALAASQAGREKALARIQEREENAAGKRGFFSRMFGRPDGAEAAAERGRPEGVSRPADMGRPQDGGFTGSASGTGAAGRPAGGPPAGAGAGRGR